MAYIKTDWKARIGSLLNRFFKEQETDRSVVLHNQPLGITQAGTPVSIQNLNKIEQGIYDAHELVEIVTQKVLNIISKIPNHASANNQLADKNFVNSSISNMAANYVTPDAAGEQQWTNLETLRAGPWFHGGTPYSPTQNDYAIFINDDNSVWRATFDGNLWSPTYKVNDTPFTAAQLAALNSQITASLVLKLLNPDSEPTAGSDNLITSGAVARAIKIGGRLWISGNAGDLNTKLSLRAAFPDIQEGDIILNGYKESKLIADKTASPGEFIKLMSFGIRNRHILLRSIYNNNLEYLDTAIPIMNANPNYYLFPGDVVYSVLPNSNQVFLIENTCVAGSGVWSPEGVPTINAAGFVRLLVDGDRTFRVVNQTSDLNTTTQIKALFPNIKVDDVILTDVNVSIAGARRSSGTIIKITALPENGNVSADVIVEENFVSNYISGSLEASIGFASDVFTIESGEYTTINLFPNSSSREQSVWVLSVRGIIYLLNCSSVASIMVSASLVMGSATDIAISDRTNISFRITNNLANTITVRLGRII